MNIFKEVEDVMDHLSRESKYAKEFQIGITELKNTQHLEHADTLDSILDTVEGSVIKWKTGILKISSMKLKR